MMRRGATLRGTIQAAYRRETEELTAQHLSLAVGLFLGFVGLSGVLEYTYYPERLPWFAAVFTLQAAACAAVLLLRRRLLPQQRIVGVCVALAVLLALSLNAYQTLVRGAPEVIAFALVCFMTGLPLLFPWGLRGQLVVVVAALIGFMAPLTVNAVDTTMPLPYAAFALATGACLSLLGARYLDLHRLAIFRETLAKEEEAEVAGVLLRIAGDLNASLDARAVIERIAHSARRALGTSWSMILLWDERRHVFRVAGMDGEQGERPEALQDMEYAPEAFPFIARALREDTVTVASIAQADRVTAALMQRYETAAMVATTLVRGGQVVGLLACGWRSAGEVTERTYRLLGGIAHHAAIALENVRLVAGLRQADRMKSEFVATMSHELRTPLSVILGYTDMLIEDAFGPLAAEQRATLERVRASSSDLLELINATLTVNRLQAGQAPVQLEEVHLDTLLGELAAETANLPRAPGVQLRWSYGNGYPPVRSDSTKLKIIIKNLVGNALKFTEHGEVTVSVQHQVDKQRLEITVADTGIGIAAADLPHIFDMFRQVPSDAAEHSGFGLGLYIVRRFVELLGGDIDVQSQPGVGSTFRLHMPVAKSTPRDA